jgi:hypothetical protein
MNWYKCYDEKAGKWVEPSCVTREGFGYWGVGEKGRRKENVYRETGYSANGRELLEGDKLRCTFPHKEIEGTIVLRDGNWVIQCDDGHYPLDRTVKYGKVRTGHISGEER